MEKYIEKKNSNKCINCRYNPIINSQKLIYNDCEILRIRINKFHNPSDEEMVKWCSKNCNIIEFEKKK